MEHIGKWINRIHQGNTLDLLKQMPDNFVDTIVTSPPYWGLRNYGSETNTIWGGDPNCNHEFVIKTIEKSDASVKQCPNSIIKQDHTEPKKWVTGFCKKCQAWFGQLGLEPNVDLYINHMLQITEQLKRVLKPTGVFFLNWGDCYGGMVSKDENPRKKIGDYLNVDSTPKCLVLQNYRAILRMIDQQRWILRNQIVWYKRNGLPSPVTDRLSNRWEPVFMLVKSNKPVYYYNTETCLMVDKKPSKEKQNERIDWRWEEVGENYSESNTKIPLEEAEKLNSPRVRVYREKKKRKVSNWCSFDYFFDLDAIRVPYTEKLNRWGGEKLRAKGKSNWDKETGQQTYRDRDMRPNKLGKNPGDMFDIPTQPFSGSHFAVFPKKLISPMIEASCPQWICKKCGKPRKRVSRREARLKDSNLLQSPRKEPYRQSKGIRVKGSKNYTNWLVKNPIKTVGWTNCNCNANFEPGIVLDPFAGSGTTAVVAKELGRNFIGIEISPNYIAMAKERLIHVAPRIDKWTDNAAISNDVVGWKWKI